MTIQPQILIVERSRKNKPQMLIVEKMKIPENIPQILIVENVEVFEKIDSKSLL